jgi:hypothetical protein
MRWCWGWGDTSVAFGGGGGGIAVAFGGGDGGGGAVPELVADVFTGMINFTNIVNGSMMTMVRSEHENPLGNIISSCPPRDWRNPEVVRIYNEILAELCRDLRIPFLDTTSIISPLWDTADDWCHYTNQVGLEEATYLAHSLSYL